MIRTNSLKSSTLTKVQLWRHWSVFRGFANAFSLAMLSVPIPDLTCSVTVRRSKTLQFRLEGWRPLCLPTSRVVLLPQGKQWWLRVSVSKAACCYSSPMSLLVLMVVLAGLATPVWHIGQQTPAVSQSSAKQCWASMSCVPPSAPTWVGI